MFQVCRKLSFMTFAILPTTLPQCQDSSLSLDRLSGQWPGGLVTKPAAVLDAFCAGRIEHTGVVPLSTTQSYTRSPNHPFNLSIPWLMNYFLDLFGMNTRIRRSLVDHPNQQAKANGFRGSTAKPNGFCITDKRA